MNTIEKINQGLMSIALWFCDLFLGILVFLLGYVVCGAIGIWVPIVAAALKDKELLKIIYPQFETGVGYAYVVGIVASSTMFLFREWKANEASDNYRKKKTAIIISILLFLISITCLAALSDGAFSLEQHWKWQYSVQLALVVSGAVLSGFLYYLEAADNKIETRRNQEGKALLKNKQEFDKELKPEIPAGL